MWRDALEYDIWAAECDKNKEWADKVWERFLRMYKRKHGVDWKPITKPPCR